LTERGVSEPGMTEPGMTESGMTEPGMTETGMSEPSMTKQPAAGINFDRRGAGEPPVLIHGIAHRWQAWEPLLDALAERHDVIAIDLSGFGKSPDPPAGCRPTCGWSAAGTYR
jgi:pimeloyl-ACP methyl ester carboxylesterase